ncbi:hypothetical protein H8959_012961 [Pygathrix nigripes]
MILFPGRSSFTQRKVSLPPTFILTGGRSLSHARGELQTKSLPPNAGRHQAGPVLLSPNHPLVVVLQSQRLILRDYFAIGAERSEKEVRGPSRIGKCSSTLEGNALEIAPEAGQHKLQFPESAASGAERFLANTARPLRVSSAVEVT